jgi:hypothetical protein
MHQQQSLHHQQQNLHLLFHAVTDNDSYDDKKENQVDFDTTNNNNQTT